MSMIADFYFSAKKQDIKPILGMEVYLVDSLAEWEIKKEKFDSDKNFSTEEKTKLRNWLREYGHLILLAKNLQGIRNLNILHYKGYQNFYNRPRIDVKTLFEHSEGLIITTACLAGFPGRMISTFDPHFGSHEKSKERGLNYTEKDLEHRFCQFKEVFGEDFYLEIQYNNIDSQRILNEYILGYAKKFDIPFLATCDAHFLAKEDVEVQQALFDIVKLSKGPNTKKSADSYELMAYPEAFLKTSEEMLEDATRFHLEV